ncbi:hypothetical protein GGTG_05776 [Gaeumannomyces tritici R3-111a-1]|uniref:Uncharacterized protein n=1 Tax=Gaeumannomyces tritici (strain R3-111a-1) TaxID=644352 RepID=J3NWW5_GAET3|nr:hypothetical protein GGTG_05776 [Gaeumannomyces tritici R3-111a-1]EJT75847.1 hypothetical protein GGTG_05776 [Gaeumannomyces tritici R3-111a-1]
MRRKTAIPTARFPPDCCLPPVPQTAQLGRRCGGHPRRPSPIRPPFFQDLTPATEQSPRASRPGFPTQHPCRSALQLLASDGGAPAVLRKKARSPSCQLFVPRRWSSLPVCPNHTPYAAQRRPLSSSAASHHPKLCAAADSEAQLHAPP